MASTMNFHNKYFFPGVLWSLSSRQEDLIQWSCSKSWKLFVCNGHGVLEGRTVTDKTHVPPIHLAEMVVYKHITDVLKHLPSICFPLQVSHLMITIFLIILFFTGIQFEYKYEFIAVTKFCIRNCTLKFNDQAFAYLTQRMYVPG